MTNYFNKKEISQRAKDELLYEYVTEEMEQEANYIKELWAEGKNKKRKALYMQTRIQSIKDDFKLLEIDYNELSKEKLWDTLKKQEQKKMDMIRAR